jgi:molybdopterin/thiamine biosynthesis adenylyltransferase
MRSKFHHEQIYRGEDLIKRLEATRIVVCGAGALGSNLVDNLTRQGFSNIVVIDMDRVETHNLNTQIWSDSDVGGLKADVLKNRVFRNVGIEIESINKELTGSTASKFLKKASLIVDAFDNSKSRQLLQDEARKQKIPCVHAGLFADYGEVIWDETYKVPGDVSGDVCDYPLARNLIMLTVSVLSEEILSFCLKTGSRRNLSITLRDLKIQPL